jgi:hypothetical protein
MQNAGERRLAQNGSEAWDDSAPTLRKDAAVDGQEGAHGRQNMVFTDPVAFK